MSTVAIVVVIIAVVVVVALIAVLLRFQMRSKHLRERFGPEYERTMQDQQGRRAAERELVDREKRHSELTLKPLSPEAHDRYTKHWGLTQEQFVDRPDAAVADADRLVIALMAERGYPTEGYEQQLAHLSVEHASTLEHYRAAHDITMRQQTAQVSTEDLRTAMVHYREIFQDLLRASGSDHTRKV